MRFVQEKGRIQVSGWLCFLLGLVVGTTFAVLVVAWLLANRISEEREQRAKKKDGQEST